MGGVFFFENVDVSQTCRRRKRVSLINVESRGESKMRFFLLEAHLVRP